MKAVDLPLRDGREAPLSEGERAPYLSVQGVAVYLSASMRLCTLKRMMWGGEGFTR